MASNIIPLALVIGLFALAGLAIVAGMRWDRKWRQQWKEVAAEHGWEYRTGAASPVATVIAGTRDDIAWTLSYRRSHYRSGGTKVSEDSVEWRSEAAALHEGSVLVIPRPPNLPVGAETQLAGIGLTLLRFVFAQAGVDSTDMSPQPVGSTLFQSKFITLSQSALTARALLAHSVESQLLNWPPVRNPSILPSVIADANGVRVRVGRGVMLTEMFGDDRLSYERQLPARAVGLGVAAVNALRGA